MIVLRLQQWDEEHVVNVGLRAVCFFDHEEFFTGYVLDRYVFQFLMFVFDYLVDPLNSVFFDFDSELVL